MAVLIGATTGSAAEYAAISLHGRANTRSFGAPTAGLTTSISGFLLADGAALGLATSAMVDRHGEAFPNGLTPDVPVAAENYTIGDPADPVIAVATEWLQSQPACQ